MLIQFSVQNFKTFREKATLSMVASNYDKETRVVDNIAENDKFNLKLLKSAVIYGANASGKSKFIEALMFMRNFVVNSSRESQVGEEIKVEPFKLNSESEIEPSEFEVVFLFSNELYRYGFEVDRHKVVSEWFFHKPKTKEIQLFYRDFQDFDTHARNFHKGTTLAKDGFVRDNALLLSVAAQFNEETALNVVSWFKAINIFSGLEEGEFKYNTLSKLDSPKQKNRILQLLKMADIDIQDIIMEEYPFDVKNEKDDNKIGTMKIKWKDVTKPSSLSYILTSHKKYDENKRLVGVANFSLESEQSQGTQKYFYLTGLIIDALDNGLILVVDELDSKIHPNLVSQLVSLFNSQKLNPKNAQLIFNTHDTNLLSLGLFRRDQIWFTEKNKFGEAQLYSLADFKAARKTEAFEDNYIRGKYGAVPYLNDFAALFQPHFFNEP